MAWVGVIVLLLSTDVLLTSAVDYKLDGQSYIVYSLASRPKEGTSPRSPSKIHMLFRTAEPSGLLLHGRGALGDFFTVELFRGKLRYASVFGRGSVRPGYQDVIVEDDLGDGQWHQVDIERYKNHVLIIVDITRKNVPSQSVRKYLNIDHEVSVGGFEPPATQVPNDPLVPRPSLTGLGFKGCMEDTSYDDVNILQQVKDRSKYVRVVGDIQSKCAEDLEYHPPATLTKPTSYIQFNITGGDMLKLGFKFRTFDHTGVMVHLSFGFHRKTSLLLELVEGRLWFKALKVGVKDLNFQLSTSTKTDSLADGLWHKIQLNVTRKSIAVQLNNETVESWNGSLVQETEDLSCGAAEIGSSVLGQPSVIGCVKDIHLNDKENVLIRSAITNDVDIDKCYLTDLCFSNPCLHDGLCSQHRNTLYCKCAGTGYQGSRCDTLDPTSVTTSSLNSMTTIISSSDTMTTVTSPRWYATVGPTSKSSRMSLIKPIATATPTPVFQNSTSDTIKLPTIMTTPLPEGIGNAELNYVSSVISTSQLVLPPTLTTSTLRNQTSSKFLTRTVISIDDKSRVDSNFEQTTASIAGKTIIHPSVVIDLHTSRVRVITPTGKSTRQNDQRVIIIEKRNEYTTVDFDKNQLLIYLFLCVVLILSLGLVVIISIKISRLTQCKCFKRFALPDGRSLSDQDSMELHGKDAEKDIAEVIQRGARSKRPPSQDDSGIDRSDCGTASNRSSTEVNEEATQENQSPTFRIDREVLDNSDGDSVRRFLVFQEDPNLYTQQSFGWSAVRDTQTLRHSKISGQRFANL